MPPIVAKLKEQITIIIKGMSRSAQIVSGTALLATIFFLVYIVTTDRTEYSTLFSGLSNDDASGIVEELKKAKTPYKLLAGGNTIAVPASKVHELRLQMASSGLPRGGGVGFEIFDKQKLGTSDFAQQVNYRRALQGELERTISQIESVKSARVHLAMPRQQLFARNKKPVSAAVTLKLYPGRLLPKSSVRAMVHLVSSSVSGLRPESVSVMDTAGTLLWGGQEGDRMTGGDTLLDHQRKVERTLENRVAAILDRALGAGRSIVKVTVEMENSSSEQTEERFDPDAVAIRSESKSEEITGGSLQNKTSGVAGVAGNLPGAPGVKGKGGVQGGSQSKKQTRNYEITKTIKRQKRPAGQLKRVSVAVLVDEDIVSPAATIPIAGATKKTKNDKKDDKKTEKAALIPSKKIDLRALELVVQQAVGYTIARGDTITLKAIPFVKTINPPVTPIPTWQKVVMSPTPYIGVGGVAAMVLMLIIVMRQKKKASFSNELGLPATLKELESKEQTNAQAEAEVEQQKQLKESALTARNLAEEAAEHDARRAAQVLRVWLAGG